MSNLNNDITARDFFASQEQSAPPFQTFDDVAAYCRIATVDMTQYNNDVDYRANIYAQALARWKYKMADAMLQERSKEE